MPRILYARMTGCECVPYTQPPDALMGKNPSAPLLPASICWKCRRSTGKCRWLQWTIPYEGSRYHMALAFPHAKERKGRDNQPYYIYSMVECPRYEGES